MSKPLDIEAVKALIAEADADRYSISALGYVLDAAPTLIAEVERLREAVWIGLDQIKWREHSGRDDGAALQKMTDLSGLRPTPPMAR